MVLFVVVKLKQIFKQHRDYPWPRPERCPRCQGCRLWGHGFVAAYFDEVPAQLLLRRFRCPGLRVCDSAAAEGLFERFQACIDRIYGCLRRRILNGRYDGEPSPSRQRHWMRALQRQVAERLGGGFRGRLLEGFSDL